MAAGALTETVAGVLAWTVRPCAELTAPLHATDYACQSHMRRLKVYLAPAEYPSMSLGERPWRSRMAIGVLAPVVIATGAVVVSYAGAPAGTSWNIAWTAAAF